MKKLSDIYKELGIDFTFPIVIKDANGNPTYSEDSDGDWYKYEYDANGNETYFERSDGFWSKREYDASGNQTYYEDSEGDWYKREYDSNGNETYFEDSKGYKDGTPRSQSCAGKVIEGDVKALPDPTCSLDGVVCEFIRLLDIEEESDNGRSFRPNSITSCRAIDGDKMLKCIQEMKRLTE